MKRNQFVATKNGRVERLSLNGDDVDDILEALSEHTRVSVVVLRPKIRVKRDDD